MMPDPPLETNLLPHHFSNMRDGHDWDTHSSVYAFIGIETVAKTAQLLGISRATFYRWLDDLNISKHDLS